MNRKTRICLWVIALGLANFVAFVVVYVIIYGEAVHGCIEVVDGTRHYHLQSGREVSRGVFIYSGVHSISIWPTAAAVMLAMLTLAKDRILASMRSKVRRARAIITVFALLTVALTAILTVEFARRFAGRFAGASGGGHGSAGAPGPAAPAGTREAPRP